MKRTYYIILLTFLSFFASSAQKTFHINAELLLIDNYSPVFYKNSENGEYHELLVETEMLYDYEYQLKINNSGKDSKEYILKKNKPLIETKLLGDITLGDLKQLNLKPIYNRSEDGKYIHELYYFNQVYLVINEYKLDRSENKWKLHDTQYHPYFFVKIDNSKNIVVILESENSEDADIEGVMYFYKNTLNTTVYGMDFEPLNDSELKIEGLQNKNFIAPSNNELYRINENNEIYDPYFNQKLLDGFDKVKIEQPFIIGEKKSKLHIYNLELQEITSKKIKALKKYTNNLAQVLVKDELKWLKGDGTLISKKEPDQIIVCGTVCYVDRKIKQDSLNFILTSKVSCPDGTNKEYVYNLFPLQQYDDVVFLNTTKKLSFDGNTGIGKIYELPGEALNYFIVKKDNKYGIVEVDFKPNPIKVTEVLSTNYDAIKPNGYYAPVRIQKDGLYGFYPQNKEPKYTELDKFYYYFARFTLPNNKKGWIDIDGTEYFD